MNHTNDSTVEKIQDEIDAQLDDLKSAFDNILGHDHDEVKDQFSDIPRNDTRPITKENFPDFSDEKIKREQYIRKMKKLYRYDYNLGPLHRSPYAGGSVFPKYETLTIKPGFKIWVDGGTIDYP